ncbi:Rhs-family protein [Janthinobacterium sp. CG23_2]|nr:Rhs-family protein [Janthinobacterium sp. CG23_2]CUU31756.1 Rhs-family protein [Janthinobacterium sp. CG23_2]
MGLVRHIAHADGWLVVATEPDLCQVGKCVVAFSSFAQLDYKHAASPDVKARGTPVYRVGDLFKNTQANAGAHIVSGTSLSTGYVQILEGHSNVKVNGIAVARHDSACRINCDSAGMGGARGQVVTMTKTVASPPAKGTAAPVGAVERVSKKLLVLKAVRERLLSGRVNFDASDEFFDFDRANAVSDGRIGEIEGTPGMIGDWAAQGLRGLLGGVKGFVMGTGELAYEAVKGVPKLVRTGGTVQGQQLAMLDKLILAEETRLGNVIETSVWQDAGGLAAAMVKPVTNPWSKGQYVESVTRGVFEAAMFGAGFLKIGSAAKAKKLLDLAKLDAAKAAAAKAAADKATAALSAAAKIATPGATKVAPAPSASGGVYVKGRTRLAKKLSAAAIDRQKIGVLSKDADDAAKAASKAKASGNDALAAKYEAVAEAKIQEARNVLRKFVDDGNLPALLDRLDVA